MKNNETLNIVYTLDDSFIPQLGASISSVILNNKDKTINIYIATDKDDTTENFLSIIKYYSSEKIKIKYVNCKDYDYIFEQYGLDRWGSPSYYVYWRLVVFDKIDCDYAWYIDTDILCLRKIDYPEIGNKVVGCVIDSVHSVYNTLQNLDKEFCFFNTGTMFVDVRKWKEKRITHNIIKFISNNNRKLIMADQDYFSISCKDDICILNPKYNFFVGYDYYGVDNIFKMYDLENKKYYTKKQIKESKNSVVFYHCLNGVFGRPWEDGNFSPIKDTYLFYRNISHEKKYMKNKTNSLLFSIEHKAELLPDVFYVKLHNLFMRIYLVINVKL